MDNRRPIIRSWEVVLAIIILFLVCSTSLYWYDRLNLTKERSIEESFKEKWEADSQKWQKEVTANIEGAKQSQNQIIEVINFNIKAGRLVMPPKEKK